MSKTWIELNLGILRENILGLKTALSAGAEIIFVVKSNAYGHGMIPVARRAWECGVKWFGVVHLDEALELRELLPDAEIIIMGAIEPADVPVVLEKNLITVIVSEKHASSLLSFDLSDEASAKADATGRSIRCHAKIDTGMGRLGFAWEEAAGTLTRLAGETRLDIQGICTHFACAGDQGSDFADVQADRFYKVVRTCRERGLSIPFKHMSNSDAILRNAAWDMEGVRAGILLYGYGQGASGTDHGPRTTDKRDIKTRPFLQWKTRVLQVKRVPAGFPVSYDSTYVTTRETCMATINVGYADGYSRLLSNRGFVLIGNRRRAVIGRVTMNFVTVDLGPVTDVREGDEATLLGVQGSESIWADEMAKWRETISYEVLANIRTDDRRLFG